LVVGLVLCFALLLITPTTKTSEVEKLDYAAFRSRVNADKVAEVEIHQDSGKIEGTLASGTSFTTKGAIRCSSAPAAPSGPRRATVVAGPTCI
jgi:hypothetical protein